MISRNPVEDIKDRLGIVDIVGRRVELRKAGRTLKGLCPFHSEKTPSFNVFPENNSYHCFGCGAHGDIFSFVMRTENLEFAEALKTLARQAGVELPSRPSQKQAAERHARLLEINEMAAEFFQMRLRNPSGKPALEYLYGRGISSDSIDSFQLGWSPDSWDGLSGHLSQRGVNEPDLVIVGLVSQRENDSGVYDRFRGRIIFPIRDEQGRLLGFGGRSLGDQQPKYLNSSDSPLFSKGACLYLIEKARQPIRSLDQAVIVEGYMDALMAHQYGERNVVASLGTALTDRQLGIIKRLTRNVTLALDADTAGALATLRGLETAREVFSEEKVVPTPRGLVRLERRLDANIEIVSLPAGTDPDDLIRQDIEQWRELLRQAKPIVDFYIERELAGVDLTSSKAVSEAIRNLLPVLAEVPDRFQQERYIQVIAQRTRMPEQLIRSELVKTNVRDSARPKRPAAPEVDLMVEAGRRGSRPSDAYLLCMLLSYPEERGELPDDLDSSEMESPAARELLRRFLDLMATNEWAGLGPWLESLEEPLRAFVEEALRLAPEGVVMSESMVREELTKTLREVRRRNLRREIDQVKLALADAESAGEDERRVLASRVEALLSSLQPLENASSEAVAWPNPSLGGG